LDNNVYGANKGFHKYGYILYLKVAGCHKPGNLMNNAMLSRIGVKATFVRCACLP